MAIRTANNQSLTEITALPSGVAGGSWVLLATETASSDATISFTSGIDSTYKEYIFKFIGIHPATDDVNFTFNVSVDTGSNYNVAKTSTMFKAYHGEDASGGVLTYSTSNDLAQGTGVQMLTEMGGDADECTSGELYLFNPSSTTFVKHFMSHSNFTGAEICQTFIAAGYGNTTSAVDAVQFKMSDGNIDAGTIKMYGVT